MAGQAKIGRSITRGLVLLLLLLATAAQGCNLQGARSCPFDPTVSCSISYVIGAQNDSDVDVVVRFGRGDPVLLPAHRSIGLFESFNVAEPADPVEGEIVLLDTACRELRRFSYRGFVVDLLISADGAPALYVDDDRFVGEYNERVLEPERTC